MKPWTLLLMSGFLWAMLGVGHAAPLLPDAEWRGYKTSFISPDGRVIDVGNQGVSHSEGQGYGMLLALVAEDRATFESLWEWTKKNLQRDDRLFGWRWTPDSNPPVQDWNNATDGDLLVAWALARAGERWQRPEWVAEARTIAQRVRATLIPTTAFGPVIIPGQEGFKEGENLTLNPSYWVFPALRTLARIDPDPVWEALRKSGLSLLALSRFGPSQLPPDWVVLHADGHLGLPSAPTKRRFGYEAIRLPIYLCWAGLKDPVLMQGFLHAWPSDDAPAWVDLANQDRAAYPLGLAQRSVRHAVSGCLGKTSGARPRIDPNDYYGSTLALFTQLILTRPEALP